MKMTRSREILSLIMSFIIAACTLVLVFSFVLNLTFSSESYYSSRFPTSKLAAECDAQLTQEYEMLAKESGFPIRVFEMVKKDMPTYQVLSNEINGAVISDEEVSYSMNLEEYFYNLCEDFADGNDMQYSKADLETTAKKAAEIYDNVVGIHNTEDTLGKLKQLRNRVTFAQFMSFVLIVICGTSTVLMYSRKRLGYYKLFGGIMGGSLGVIFASVVLYFVKPVKLLNIKPAIFLDCLSDMASQFFTISALIAVAFLVVSLAFTIKLERDYEKSKDKVKIV